MKTDDIKIQVIHNGQDKLQVYSCLHTFRRTRKERDKLRYYLQLLVATKKTYLDKSKSWTQMGEGFEAFVCCVLDRMLTPVAFSVFRKVHDNYCVQAL